MQYMNNQSTKSPCLSACDKFLLELERKYGIKNK